MPEQATYDDIKKFAEALSDKGKGIYGITLRGKPGWGENMAFVTTLVNTFGGAYFDMEWNATIDTPEWKNAITYYVDLMKAFGPPGATSNGFNENLTIFATGKAAMWIDATSGAGPLFDPKESQVSDKVAFANAPIAVTPNGCPLAVVLGVCNPQVLEVCGGGQRSLRFGLLLRNTSNWSPRRPVGQQFLPEPGNRSTITPSIRRQLRLLR